MPASLALESLSSISITVSLYFLCCSSSNSVCSVTINLAVFFIQVVSVIVIIIVIIIIGIINQSGLWEDFDSIVYIFIAVGKGHLHLVKFSMSLGDDLVIFITSLLFCLLHFICKSSKAFGGTCGGDW